jgi:hypothetical protein
MAARDIRMPEKPDKFRTLTCLEGKQAGDPLLDEIQQDVKSSSLLEAMKRYIDELRGTLDNNARPFKKIARLFDAGITPERVEGHHDGVAIGLRTGDEHGLLASYGNFMGLLWGTAVGPVAPWVGKSFDTVDDNIIQRYTEGTVRDHAPTYVGINHFNQLPDSVVNQFTFSVLSFWMHLKEAPKEEKDLYGHDRDGGLFIARKAPSVYAGTNREVFQLNYRWANLGNAPPFTYLIDELVGIADGVYLGQLLFATSNLLSHFDPSVPNADYHYQHFGYFLLMDDTWAAETRRVFSNIEPGQITAQLGGLNRASQSPAAVQAPASQSKFSSLMLSGPADGNCNDALFAEMQGELRRYETILDLLKFYSTQLQESLENQSLYFGKLLELFNRGKAPDEVRGYFRGALISFHSEGFYKLFSVNTLDFAWKLGKFFTPWTGKTFEDMSRERLADLTDGIETGAIPTFWGTNTLSFKTAQQKFVRQMMKLVGVPSEEVPAEEARKYGYDLKSFFFISHTATSINDENKGKRVFQFNYRWPKLHTFPPDNYCIDELVMLADGLYLGQLIYATELLKKFDPKEDPSAYKYRVFGYFLLMDEDWQKKRLQIGLDPYDV